MKGMPSIREHWIDTNPGLKGPIYDFIGDITTLESWSMTFNSVTGTIPTTLGNLVDMQQMWLYSNQLTGTIPTELGKLTAMKSLQLEGNNLMGSMPLEICANTAFPGNIEVLGADCDLVDCSCCTCCNVLECGSTTGPTSGGRFDEASSAITGQKTVYTSKENSSSGTSMTNTCGNDGSPNSICTCRIQFEADTLCYYIVLASIDSHVQQIYNLLSILLLLL